MGRQKHQVAVVVFAEIEGYDERDAESGLMLAVRQNLAGPRMGLPQVISGAASGSGPFEATVCEVMGLKSATGDNYVSLHLTHKAFRDLER